MKRSKFADAQIVFVLQQAKKGFSIADQPHLSVQGEC